MRDAVVGLKDAREFAGVADAASVVGSNDERHRGHNGLAEAAVEAISRDDGHRDHVGVAKAVGKPLVPLVLQRQGERESHDGRNGQGFKPKLVY